MRTFARVALSVAPFALVTGSLLVAAAGPMLLTESSEIVSEPGAARFGVLMAGTPVRVLEARDGWLHVSVEGWIRTDEDAPVPAVPGAAAMPAVATGTVTLSGKISLAGAVKGKGGPVAASGVALRLVSDPEGNRTRLDEARASCAARRGPLVDQAAKLKEQANVALSTTENTATAFEAYDEAKWQRKKVVAQLRSLDEDCRASEESVLESATVARTLTDPTGAFVLRGVPPGRYLLTAILETKNERHIWEMDVDLSGGDATVDLTPDNRTAVEPATNYR